MVRRIRKLGQLLFAGSVALLPRFSFGQFKIPDPPAGIPNAPLPSLIAQIIKIFLLLVGVIALGFIVYGGFRYITSRGDEREVQEAKDTITYAVIGILVIGLAYAIVAFVFGAIGGAPPGGDYGGGGDFGPIDSGGGGDI